ncbi:hypothetical protein Tcan_10929 [Toxocara canis]|uniref:Uncharacterized protein n=1 Tax=Toxocara canis TaxID=6265 RepID=A0A0B2VGL9_TOXCA|nr:hypothetical protein Tcan_10929 [Toxocara canis]
MPNTSIRPPKHTYPHADICAQTCQALTAYSLRRIKFVCSALLRSGMSSQDLRIVEKRKRESDLVRVYAS